MLVGGDIWTMDPRRPRAQAVAVRGDRIIAVGDAAAVKPHTGPSTRVIELAGRTVTPGLVDAHCHLYGLGVDLENVSLREATSEAAAAKVVAEAARKASAGQWLLGRGWDQNRWPGQKLPTRASLDAQVKDRTVVLTRVDGHAIWVNSFALRAAGITRATKDPAGGKIVRDARGEATGVLIDNAMGLVTSKAPPPTAEVREARIASAAKIAAAAGLTAVHEMGIDDGTVAAYQKLAASGQLPVRVVAYLSGSTDRLDMFKAAPPPAVGRFAIHGVKFYADGALGSRGARLYAPYTDDPHNHGLWRIEPDKFPAVVEAAAATGWQVATHAIGDAGVGAVLDAYQAVQSRHKKPLRLRVEHTQVIAAKDVPRMAAAGAIASMQPTHATSDMPWAEARLGPERVLGAYAWRTLRDAKIPIASGSDFPVEEVSPLLGLYAAVSRQNAQGAPPDGWYPAQRMTLAEAIDGFTRGAAYAEFAEAERGTIAPGYRADVTVLSGALAPDVSMLSLQVDYTVVDGQIVHERAAKRD